MGGHPGSAPTAPHRGPLRLAATMSPVEPGISAMDIGTSKVCADDLDLKTSSGIDGWLEPERLPANWMDAPGAGHEGIGAALGRRVFDIVISAGLLLFTLPVLILTAIAIRLETRGPVFYRQERVGRDGQVFTLFKFRSMTVDAEANGGAVWAVPQDPRVTRVGRFIRLTRIDEIPQVLNVLRGDMAFIGPRPERPVFVAQLERAIPHYADRAAVKPGITGWAQVRYRYGASVEDARMKLGYDLYYIRHRSLALDLRILAGTVRVVLLQEGAR
jgi:exopolysaccharide biosynthesis polyprenyl glycosylphosphotransferase